MFFAVLMCLFSLFVPFLLAKLMGYNAGEAAGLLAGSQTISAVLGVAEDTINQSGLSAADKTSMINVMPCSLCCLLYFRYGRFCLADERCGSPFARRTAFGKEGL